MRVFLAGASGVLGRRLVPRLVGAGHTVVGLTRSPEKADALAGLGAEPVVCDVFDAEALTSAVTASRAEVVVHQLTRIPRRIRPRKLHVDLAGNDRIRREGTHNLAAAARAAGARRLVSQSVAFAYAPGREEVDEGSPLQQTQAAPKAARPGLESLRALEAATTGVEGLEGVVLRYGYFYGAGTSFADDGTHVEDLRGRRLPLVGSGRGCWPLIHLDDAASAAVAAVEGSGPGVYNVAEPDAPTAAEWLPRLAEVVGAPRPPRVPCWLARLVAGGAAVYAMDEHPPVSSARFHEETGWTPVHDWREAFADARNA